MLGTAKDLSCILSTRNDRGNAGRTIDLEIVDVGVELSPE